MSNFLKPPCDAAQIRTAAFVPGVVPPACRHWVLAATILGSSMAFIDSTVVNVALPVLQSDLHASLTDTQWVIESYALLLTALVLVGGSLGDQIGRRTTFSLGVAVFSLASVWCGLSSDIHSLIAARTVQGIGAALLVPASLALLSASYPEDQRGRAIGSWSGSVDLTAALGPVLGGWFIQKLSWRWAFFINVPVGIIVLLLLLVYVPKAQESTGKRHLDWRGAAIATLSLASLVYGLLELPALGASSVMALATVIGGIAGLVLFVIVEANQQGPMMPLDVFRSKDFSGANLLTLFLYAALSGALFFVPFNLIQVQKYTPLEAGTALLPFPVIMFLLSRWAGGLVTRYGSRLPLTIGPLIAGLGFVLFALPNIGGSYWKTFFPAISILGLGMAITVAPLTATVMGSVGQNRSGAASGINNAVARLAGVLAIALLGLAIQSAFSAKLNQRITALKLPAESQEAVTQQHNKLAAIEIPSSLDATLQTRVQSALDESFIFAFRQVVLIGAMLAFISAVAAALTISHRQKKARNSRTAA
jgi:EmrB/QacA subfamily drug resistance transporter